MELIEEQHLIGLGNAGFRSAVLLSCCCCDLLPDA